MNVKLLTEYRSLRQEMIEIDDRIKEIRESAKYPKSPQLTGMPRVPGYSSDSLSRIFEQIEELTEFYLEKQVQLNDLCLQIENEIKELPSLERRIIRFRYLDNKPWPEISKIMGRSIAQLHRLHKKILLECKNDAP